MTQATYVPNAAHTDAQALLFFQQVLSAIATLNAGSTEPSETFGHMLWMDTAAGYVKKRTGDNSAWERFIPLAPTQTQEVWDAGESTVESLISPAKLGQVSGALEAAFAAAAGAPRLDINALERLTVGNVTTSSNDADHNVTNGSSTRVTLGFLQTGTIRVTGSHRGAAGGNSIMAVLRTRNNVTSTVASWSTGSSTYQARTVDVGVIPGDYIQVRHTGSGGQSRGRNFRIRTNGAVNVWPGGNGQVTGNSGAT